MSRIFCVLTAALLSYGIVRFCIVGNMLEEAEEARRTLFAERQALREESAALGKKLSEEPDEREIEKLARERLGLVLPDETIFYFTNA